MKQQSHLAAQSWATTGCPCDGEAAGGMKCRIVPPLAINYQQNSIDIKIDFKDFILLLEVYSNLKQTAIINYH
ncbi:MAG: hypothetical protein RRZ73_05260 [Oscillospiraceae bacterium]